MNRRRRTIVAGLPTLALAGSIPAIVDPQARAQAPAGRAPWAVHFTPGPTPLRPGGACARESGTRIAGIDAASARVSRPATIVRLRRFIASPPDRASWHRGDRERA